MSNFWGAYGALVSNPKVAGFLLLFATTFNIALICSSYMWDQPIETEIKKLWINPSSEAAYAHTLIDAHGQKSVDTLTELISLQSQVNTDNVVTAKNLLRLNELNKKLYDLVAVVNGTAYTVYDVCEGRAGQSSYVLGCNSMNPLDFFKEGDATSSIRGFQQSILDGGLPSPVLSFIPLTRGFHRPFALGGPPNGMQAAQHWQWVMYSDLCLSPAPGVSEIFSTYFSQECEVPKKHYCREVSSVASIPAVTGVSGPTASFFSTSPVAVTNGPGTLFDDWETLLMHNQNNASSLKISWQRAHHVLVELLKAEIASPASTCIDWTAVVNTATPAISVLGGATFSLANCGVTTGGMCPGTTCVLATLQAHSFSTYVPGAENTACGACVAATMYWMGDFSKFDATVSPSIPAPVSPNPLAATLAYDITQQANAKVFFTTYSEAQCSAVGTSVLSVEECTNVYSRYVMFKKNVFLNTAGSKQSAILETYKIGAALQARNPSTELDRYMPRQNRDTIHRTALTSHISGISGSTHWILSIPFLAAAGLSRTVALTIVGASARHYLRPPIQTGLNTFLSDQQLLNVLSADDGNDLVIQNLKLGMYGGTTPPISNVTTGFCTCLPGYGGSTCLVPITVKDDLCSCRSPTDPKCMNALLVGLSPFMSCASFATIGGFAGTAASDNVALLAGFSMQPQLAQVKLLEKCQAFSFCVDVSQDFSFSALQALVGSTITIGGSQTLDANWANHLSDATYLSAFLSDLQTNSLLNRATLYLRVCGQLPELSCLGLTTFDIGLGFSLDSTDFSTLSLCSSVLDCTAAINTGHIGTDLSGACPGMASVVNTNIFTLGEYFQCYAEAAHNPASTAPTIRGEAFGLKRGIKPALMIPFGGASPVKSGFCMGAIATSTGAMNSTDCIGALATSTFSLLWKAIPTLVTSFNQTQAFVISALGGDLPSQPSAVPGCAVVAKTSQEFASYLQRNVTIVQELYAAMWNGNQVQKQMDIDAFLAYGCILSKACYSPQNLMLPDVQTVLDNFLPATTGDTAALGRVSLVFTKYIFTGTLAGICGATGVLKGGKSCSKDSTCNAPFRADQGVCTLQPNPFTKMTSIASVLFTISPEALMNKMSKTTDALLYREFVNQPILKRFNDSLAAQLLPVFGRRRRLDNDPDGPQPGGAPPHNLDDPISQIHISPYASFGELGTHTITFATAELILKEFRHSITDLLKHEEYRNESVALTVTAASSEDMVEISGGANVGFLVLGYGLMVLYAQVTLTMWTNDNEKMFVQSRTQVGALSVIFVALSVAAGLGISAHLKLLWSSITVGVLPYVMLSLGVDDVFVLIRTFPSHREGVSREEACRFGMAISGPSMLLTSTINAGAFGIGMMTGMPVIVDFALQALIIVCTNWITMITVVPSLLSLDYLRQERGGVDCAPFIKFKPHPQPALVQGKTERNVFNTYVVGPYLRMLFTPFGIFLSMGLMIALVVSASVAIEHHMVFGLQLVDIVPPGTQMAKAVEIRDRDFSFYQVVLITGETDYSKKEVQQNLAVQWSNMDHLPNIVRGTGTPWITVFMNWGLPSTPSNDLTKYGRVCDPTSRLIFNGLCGEKMTPKCTVVMDDPSLLKGSIPYYPKKDFYRCLEHWLNLDVTYDVIKPAFPLVNPDAPRASASNPLGSRRLKFSSNETDANGTRILKLAFSRGGFFANGLATNEDYVDLINNARNVTGSEYDPPSYPSGTPIDFWDQYVGLQSVISSAIGYGLLLVYMLTWFISVLVGQHVPGTGLFKRVFVGAWASAITTSAVTMVVFLLYGFMVWSQIKMSAIPAISVIMTTGVAVEFCSHISLAFCNAAGTRLQRIEEAMDIMFAPNLDGGISTILGVLMLLSSVFPFVIRYFFLVWVLIVIFGWIVSLLFLPVLLVFIGPPSMMGPRRNNESNAKVAMVVVDKE